MLLSGIRCVGNCIQLIIVIEGLECVSVWIFIRICNLSFVNDRGLKALLVLDKVRKEPTLTLFESQTEAQAL